MMRADTREDKVREFDKVTGPRFGEGWTDPHVAHLRYKLMEEELKEVKHEITMVMFKLGVGKPITKEDRKALLKELCDLQYVLSGTILAFSFDDIFDVAFNRVHSSNMSKIGPERVPVRRDDGKILKSEYYIPACFEDLID